MERQLEYVLRTVEERGVRFVRLWFTDVLGFLKSVEITPAELEVALEEGMTFDGSTIGVGRRDSGGGGTTACSGAASIGSAANTSNLPGPGVKPATWTRPPSTIRWSTTERARPDRKRGRRGT